MITNKLLAAARPIKSLLAKYPNLKSKIRVVVYDIWRWEAKLRTVHSSKDFDVNRTIWINPERIKYDCLAQKGYDKFDNRGKVVGGDWDKRKAKFTELDIYKACEKRFMFKRPWDETEFYNRVLKEIDQGKVQWNCSNKTEFKKRLIRLDALYQDIKVNGYKTQEKLSPKHLVSLTREDEITVRIDRYGAFLFEDGRHRLAIAKLLGLKKIPVKITVRHSEWHLFRNEVLNYAASKDGLLYQAVTHPDLNDIPANFDEKRFEMMKAHLPFKGGDLLDIGAHWGYFCHRFEEEGFNCYAIESDTRHIYFLKKLKIAENRQFKVIAASIFEYHEKTDFDVVLALNIFHHFLKKKHLYYQLKSFLKRLQIKVMFFQAHVPNSPQMQGAYRDYDDKEFVNFILENSMLSQAAYLGKTEDDRPLYMLT